MRLSSSLFVTVALLASVITAGGLVIGYAGRTADSTAASTFANSARTPFVLTRSSPQATGSNEIQTFVADSLRHPPDVELNIATACHLLRLYKHSAIPNTRFVSGDHILRLLTNEADGTLALGASPFYRTRTGVRFRAGTSDNLSGWDGESHRDLVLATLAELGVPADQRLEGIDYTSTIRDVLDDSIATFTLEKQELPWTAIALALYASDSRSWINQEGASFTFDDLLTVLVNTDLSETPCGGTHFLYAVATIVQVDAARGLLSSDSRSQALEYLRKFASIARQAQLSDGSWTSMWHGQGEVLHKAALESSKLLVTGHQLEWMALLPPELGLSKPEEDLAVGWIVSTMTKRAKQGVTESPCPWVHNVGAVQHSAGLDRLSP